MIDAISEKFPRRQQLKRVWKLILFFFLAGDFVEEVASSFLFSLVLRHHSI